MKFIGPAILVFAMFIPSHGGFASGRIRSAAADINSLSGAVHMYKLRKGEYPYCLGQLLSGGYLRHWPTDPWGVKYRYSRTRPGVAPTDLDFYIWTLGVDNEPGGEHIRSDIGNWENSL